MMIVKNGIRIAIPSMLAVYVDPAFFLGDCITKEGTFFLRWLLLLPSVLALLQRRESKSPLVDCVFKNLLRVPNVRYAPVGVNYAGYEFGLRASCR